MRCKIIGVTFFAGGKFNVTILEDRRSGVSKAGQYEGYGQQALQRGVWGMYHNNPDLKNVLIAAVNNNAVVDVFYNNLGEIDNVQLSK